MAAPPNAELVAEAVAQAGIGVRRSPGRRPEQGLLEIQELAPALRDAMDGLGGPMRRTRINAVRPIADWTRPRSQVDLFSTDGSTRLVAELKAWDIDHQLFDLAKVTCLLAAGASAGFLVCVAYRERDFDLSPAGALFPADVGTTHEHDVAELLASRPWRHSVRGPGPKPTAVPTRVATVGVASAVPIDAYPGHSLRAAEVRILDPAPIALADGLPLAAGSAATPRPTG